MKKEFDAMDERCNPQCMLNQEPGYVIYSAVGSFYAPMLVMMFFNWRIYQTAKKTTMAIRNGLMRVKGINLWAASFKKMSQDFGHFFQKKV